MEKKKSFFESVLCMLALYAGLLLLSTSFCVSGAASWMRTVSYFSQQYLSLTAGFVG